MLMYKKAGVDIAKGDQITNFIKRKINPSISTGFNGTIPINTKQSIVGSTDGVGTKLKLAFQQNKHETIGIDLVAMSVNDVICSGASPKGFFDYISYTDVDVDILKDILIGIKNGCDLVLQIIKNNVIPGIKTIGRIIKGVNNVLIF